VSVTAPPGDGLLLLHTAALPTLAKHQHANLGRLMTPGCCSRAGDTFAAGRPVAYDNECYRGRDDRAIAGMLNRIAGIPSVAARIQRAWGQRRPPFTPPGDPGLPAVPPSLLWVALPDDIRCACGSRAPCKGNARRAGCAPIGDAAGTLALFERWHMWHAHLPAAFVLQDGSERPGMIPWDHIAGVFVGGSTAWKLGAPAADLVREARRRGLHAHMGRCSTAGRMRYARSIGCTSIDSSRFSMWRDLLLDDGLAQAANPPQLRLIP
jgi:hypothetical protein